MTPISDGSSSPREDDPRHSLDEADQRLRETSSKIIFGAAAIAGFVGLLGIVNSTGTGGSMAALILAAVLAVLGYRRSQAPGDGGAKIGRIGAKPTGPIEVTDEDVDKARTLNGDDLDFEDVCRLTRGAYAWWSESQKAEFRSQLEDRLRG